MQPDPIRALATAATFYARNSAAWLEQCLDCLIQEIIVKAASERPEEAGLRN
ncbi:MAG TPA: hypothetical protein VKE22_24765 [Haliangiales bacterium]|nr:hypothetical protein [Haliangiales bacterium]